MINLTTYAGHKRAKAIIIIIIIIISDSVQNLKGVWVHNTNTKVQGAKLQSVVCEIT